MGRPPIFAIMAFVFTGIIKLLQVTVFDAEQYEKSQKANLYVVADKKDVIQKTKKKEEILKPSDLESQVEENTSPSMLDHQEKNEPLEKEEQPQPVEEQKKPKEDSNLSNGLSELKNNYLTPIVATLSPGQLRQDVIVRYYKHEKDGDIVYWLKNLSYYIHEREATETTGLKSNILYYGDHVAVEDIKIVAYTLMDQGLSLKAIENSQFGWKSTALEIGTDTLLLDNKTLTIEDIQSFKK